MDNIFRKFCHYYLTDQDEYELEEIKEMAQEEFDNYQIKVQEFIEELKKQTSDFGYGTDFESLCNLLEEYINKKDNLTDEEKSNYLKVLMTLSEIHEVNLREELERYISYKKKTSDIHEEKEIFNKFCHYNLNENSTVEEFNELKELAEKNNIDFKEFQKQAIIYVEELKISAENLGYNIEEEKFEEIVEDYLNKKKKLTDNEKSRYLKLLLYLSEIYGVNLRELLTKEPETSQTISEISEVSLNDIYDELSDPLENEELLSLLLTQRYENGYFNVREIILKTDSILSEYPYDFEKEHANLTYRLYRIFLDKFNNYAFDDLNQEYLNLITEEDIERLSGLTEEDLYEILKLIKKRESSHYIIKKFKLTHNLYSFIEKSAYETTDINLEHIGTGLNSLFNLEKIPYTFRIYLNGSDYELHKFLNEYIFECVSNDLNYDMKARGEHTEKCILYANTNDITKKLSIIDKIFQENPNYIKKFTNPIHSSSRLNDSIYGISHSGVIDENLNCTKSYTDYFNSILEVAYYRILSKIVLEAIKDKSVKEKLNNFINLSNVSFEKAEMKSPEQACYNELSFEVLKDLINQYIPLVSSTINIYMTNPENNPAIIDEFKKSITYISNITEGREKRAESLITINRYLENLIKNN